MKQAERRMADAVAHLEETYRGISTGRARPSLLEHIRVEVYDQQLPLHHIATVGLAPGGKLRILPFDQGTRGAIRKALLTSKLGLNPQTFGQGLLVSIPPIDEEQQRRLCLRARGLAEDQRVAVRNVRKDARNKAKREGRLNQVKKGIEELTKAKIAEVEELLEGKLAEINWVDPDWNDF